MASRDMEFAAADFDGNGLQDVVFGTPDYTEGAIHLLPGALSRGFYDLTPTQALWYSDPYGSLGWEIATGLIDGDSTPDLLYAISEEGTATVAYSADPTDEEVLFTGIGTVHRIWIDNLDADADAEIMIGIITDDTAATDAGAIYVFNDITLTGMTLADADLIVTGIAENAEIGEDAAIGDVNGDSSPDLIVGSKLDLSLDGRAYIFYGPLPTGIVAADTADVIIEAAVGHALLGAGVAVIGDVDDDDVDDFAIGAGGEDDYLGAAYVFTTAPAAGSVLASAAGLKITGTASNGTLGVGVSAAGDLNDDGIDDFAVGAPGRSSSTYGYVYLFYGPAPTGTVVCDDADAIFGIEDQDGTGRDIHPIGDVNGDGIAELVIVAGADDKAWLIPGGI